MKKSVYRYSIDGFFRRLLQRSLFYATSEEIDCSLFKQPEALLYPIISTAQQQPEQSSHEKQFFVFNFLFQNIKENNLLKMYRRNFPLVAKYDRRIGFSAVGLNIYRLCSRAVEVQIPHVIYFALRRYLCNKLLINFTGQDRLRKINQLHSAPLQFY